MRIVPADLLAQLTDPRNWRDNPFVRRDAQRDAKRKQPVKSLAWMLGTLSLLGGPAIWLLLLLHGRGHGIPWMLGGSFGTALCIVVCGVHSWFISASARKHTQFMILLESYRNTLPSLLMLPLPPFQLLVQAGVYPWLAAMRMALAGLPFYMLAVAVGGLSWLDLVMLYVVFAALSVAFPSWSRPILTSDSPFAVTMQANAQAANTNASAQAASLNNASSFSAIGSFLPFTMLFVFFGGRHGGLGALHESLNRYAPDSILQLIPTAIFSWPLLVARALVTPFEWFGIPLPPLPFAVLSFALGRYLQIVRSSEFLSVGTYRDLATRPTYTYRRRLSGALAIGQIVVVIGYLWKWAIVDGGLAFVVDAALYGADSALAAFVFLLLFVATWRGMLRAGAIGTWLRRGEAATGPARAQIDRSTAWRFVAVPYLFAAGLYLTCCLLSRTWPFPAPVCALAGKMLSIGVAAALLSFAMRRSLPGTPGLGLIVLSLATFGPSEFRSLAVLSPTVGMLNLSKLPPLLNTFAPPGLSTAQWSALWQALPPWWAWTLACGGVGGLLLLWSRPAPAAAPESPPLMTLDPTQYGPEVFLDAAFERKTEGAKTESPLGLEVVRQFQRVSDNAVAVKELRARMRGKLHPRMLQLTVVLFVVITIALFSLPSLSRTLGSLPVALLFGPALPRGALPVVSVLGCWYLGLLWAAFGVGLGLLPQVFAPEREKSTLGFLLLSPMRATSIVFGKAVGLLIPAGLFAFGAAVWTLALTIPVGALVGLPLALSAWLQVVVTAIAVALSSASFSLAVASLFPRTVNQAGCGVVLYMLLFQVPFQVLIQLRRPLRYASFGSSSSVFGGSSLWIVFLIASMIFSAICILLAVWGVQRMRRRDIAFESSKREN